MSQFHLSDENPNEQVGGKGCLCHPRGSDETRGPYLIFTPTTTDDNLSPHAVLCAGCACDAKEDVVEYQQAQIDAYHGAVIDIPEEDVTEESDDEVVLI